VKETDLLFTNDTWRVVMEIDLSAYHDTISVIKSYLMMIEQQKQDFMLMAKLKQIDSLLKMLDSKLNDFQQVLPRVDPRHGLLDVGGLVLKQIFGTATIADIQSIHEIVDELRQGNSDIAHSVSNQLTYVEDLAKINAEAITNLSSVLKDQMLRSHDQFLSIAKDMCWLNATLQTESSMFTVIRHLELTLVQLIQQRDELFDAVQYAILGKLPIKIVNPLELQNILRNVTLQLPESYKLVAGTNQENMHLYMG